MRLAAILMLVVAGCQFESNLVPCGDLSCPSFTTCVADRCVTPAQLASCTDKTADETCAVDSRVGVCRDGACTYVGCGNGVVDSGELCDDANTTFGDGCSGDCASLEICGNGVVDFGIGETCDCGVDATTQPGRCGSPNSADPDTECSQACELRYCGDAAIDALEQCDGDLLGTNTCDDFGYYHGQPTCSAGCLVEVSGCYGRCGDLDVEPAFGEFCDGARPPGTCMTYGLDAGYTECSTACSPDLAPCERFGVVQVEARSARAIELLDSVPVILGASPDGVTNAWAAILGARVLAPAGDYLALATDETLVYAIARDHIAVWNGIEWKTRGVGWPPTTGPIMAWGSSELGIYVVVDGAVWRYTTTWQQQPVTGIVGVTGTRGTVFVWRAAAAWSSTGGAFSTEALPALGAASLKLVIRTPDGPTWVAAGTQLYRDSGTGWLPRQLDVRNGRVDAAGNLIAATTSGTLRIHATSGASELLLGTMLALSTTPDDGVAAAGTLGAFSLRTTTWNERNVILAGWAYDPYDQDTFTWLDVASDGSSVIGAETNYAVWVGEIANGTYFSAWDANYPYPTDLSILPGGTPLLALHGDVVDLGGTYFYDQYAYDTGGSYLGSYPVTQLDATPTGNVLATGDGVVARITTTGMQRFLVPDHNLRAASESTDGTIFALGSFGSATRLLRIAADGSYIVLIELSISDFFVTPEGGVVATASGDMYRCLPQATTCTVLPLPLDGYQVAGTSFDDLFVAGWPKTGQEPMYLAHWNGTRWIPVRTPTTSMNHLHVTSSIVGFVDGYRSTFALTRVARW